MSEWMTINEFRGANRSSEEGLPDNHIITIRERVLTVDRSELIQNNVKTDTVTLELDSEWDGINPIIIFECSDENYQVAYTGEPVHIPQAVMLKIGRIGCSVCGLDDTGEIRLVTKAAPNIFTVMESGSYIGEVSDDDVSLLGQILAAADAANAAVDKVENASFTATATTLEPGESATAQITGDDLKMTVAFGIPKGEKGEKGDKGDPGEQGIQGIPGVDGQDGQDGAPGADGFSPTVEVSKDGSVTTISITDKTGPKTAQINDGLQGPPGEKGDPGAPGADGQNGVDGFSPTVEVSKDGSVTTISITDKTGVKTAEISDGAKGDKGDKGDPGETPDVSQFVARDDTGKLLQNGAAIQQAVIDGGTAEPDYILKRTVDNINCEAQFRIDSEAVAGIRYNVGGSTVNALYLEQTKTRLRKPLDVGSGGVPQDGTAGQILKKGQNGAEWVDSIVVDVDVADVAAKASVAVVDDPENPTSGIVLKTDLETDKTIITGVGDEKIDEIYISDLDENATDDRVVNKKYVDEKVKQNVLLGTATGHVAHAEDAYAAKPREVRIKGKTVKNLWPKSSGSSNGITLSFDDTGLFTLSGTSTNVAWFGVNIPMTPNTNLELSSTLPSTTAINVTVEFYNDAGDFLGKGDKTAVQINTPEGTTKCKCVISIPSDTTVDTAFRVMLVEGTKAPDCFTPVGVHGVYPEKLVVSGKNLLPSSELTTDLNGNHTTDVVSIPPGTYTISCAQKTDQIIFRRQDGSDVFHDSYRSTKRTFELAVPEQGYFIFYRSESIAGDITNPQLELGSTATAYEPPNVTEVTLPETDPLMYIHDRGDEMVIAQDGAVSVERQTYHELFDGGTGIATNSYIPIEADGYQYVALNSTKDKSNLLNINLSAVISDRFAAGKKIPGHVVLTTGAVSGDGRNYIAFLFCFEPGTFADADEVRQWFADNPTNVWFAGVLETEQMGTVQLPQLPAPTFNQYHDSDVPSDTSTTYARDINIVLANLEAVQTALLGGE